RDLTVTGVQTCALPISLILGVSELTGRFQEFSGSVTMNDKTEPVSVSLKINSGSIDTGHKMRDNHLKANDFLGTKEHSSIVFLRSEERRVGKECRTPWS